MEQVMLDLETWGTEPGCALRSIGAKSFDLHGGAGDEFYRNIDRQSCLDIGLTVDPETEKWWTDQSLESRQALEPDQKPIIEALCDFLDFVDDQKGKYIWCQGANFDEPILHAAADKAKIIIPWSFRNVRDTRTVYHIASIGKVDRDGVRHNALDDARYQVKKIHACLRKVGLLSMSIVPKAPPTPDKKVPPRPLSLT